MAAVEVAHADEGYATNAGTPKYGPVLTMMSKRLRALKKKYNKILQIEESKAQGKAINREQEEVLKTKIAIAVLIDEYEKLRQPLLTAVQEELAEKERELMSAGIGSRELKEDGAENDKESDNREEIRKEVVNANVNLVQGDPEHTANGFSNGALEHGEPQELVVDGQYQIDDFRQDADKASLTNDTQKESVMRAHGEKTSDIGGLSEAQAADLLNLMYFARLFDVGPDGVPSFVWTKVHERSSCLSYDFVFDDATTPLTERDLDALSFFGALLTSRPPNVTLSHKDALQQCILHARLWLLNSDIRIHPDLNTSYTGLRERLNRILSSEYFTMAPELQTVTQQTAAAAAAATAASQYVSNILISDAMVGTPVSEADAMLGTLVSEVEDSSMQEMYQASSQQPYFEGEYVSAVSLSAENVVPLADSTLTIKPACALENSSVAVNVLQHTNGLEDDQTALSQHSASEQEAHHHSPVSRQRQQHNPPHYGGSARGGGYQGLRGSGRGYGYGMGGRGRGHANGRANRGGRGYPYGRGGQFHDQGGYYPRNQYGGRSGRGGRADFNNGHMNGTSKTVVTGEA